MQGCVNAQTSFTKHLLEKRARLPYNVDMKNMHATSIRIRIAILLMAAFMMLCGCQKAEAEPALSATAAPVEIVHVPVETLSAVRAMPLPSGETAHSGYTMVDGAAVSGSLFAFTDTEGTVQYRVFGGYDRLLDGVVAETITGFYPSDESGALQDGAQTVDPDAEPFGGITPMALPDTLRMVVPFTETEHVGVYRLEDGRTVAYGSVGASEPCFYPASADGAMITGALPIGEQLTEPAYLPTEPPTADGERKLVVYIGTQSVVSFLAKDGEWTEERIMACSTGRSKDMTPRGSFKIMRQYLYKKMGEVKGENVYSQYTSRITGSYLFHSVPIGGNQRHNPTVGKRQMITSYYEMLGKVASGGCVRLRCADAYWIYINCEVGTPVIVTDDNGPAAPAVPELIYEEPYTNKKGDLGWDPSDPDPENPYHQVYEPETVLTGPVIDKDDD